MTLPRLTLDTSAVLAAINDEPEAPHIKVLIAHANRNEIQLAVTSGLGVDQRRANDVQRGVMGAWLAQARVLYVPGPFRFDMSALDGPDGLASDETARLDRVISGIVLPSHLGPELAGKRMNDVHHLIAHHLSGNDVFVTKDGDDMIRKSDQLRREVGIVVKTPAEAVEWVQRELQGWEYGTRQKFIKPHCPWQNGKVERLNRTLATEWAYRQVFTSNDQRVAALAPWLEYYNTERRHSALGGKPLSRLPPT